MKDRRVGMQITGNQAAFVAVVASSTLSIVTITATATATSAVAMVVFGAMAITASGLTLGSIAAWTAAEEGEGAEAYFKRAQEYVGVATAGLFGTISQVFGAALVEGIAKGITNGVRGKVEDFLGLRSDRVSVF